MRLPILTFFIICVAGSAYADGAINSIITASDKARLETYETTKSQALDEARKGGEPADVAKLNETLSTPTLGFSEDFDLTGNWQCRTTKLGKTTPLVIYGWFKCRITDDGAGWLLEKISGSQRTKGRFFTDSDTRLTYLGSGYVAGEQPKKYGAGADTDEVGYAYRTSKDSFRIEFPAPARESLLDILELKR
ncbi:DUF4893 domain-containing protein [Phyllobacterium sp. YR531]|uniref:DUF4893 domain-containing protein n=1 Tax=Phyllobacterium sp. YR531 TaxID=1144343 RepID=UPI00026F7E35|nr:DUF4893 domain-containing protein [Phyllobacterium sp. YR531]EJN03977.1 hypothetical protein PMI41_01612 [Phyllobacterium sp. YR531]